MSTESDNQMPSHEKAKTRKELLRDAVTRDFNGQELPREAVNVIADMGNDLILALTFLRFNSDDELAKDKAIGAHWVLNALGQQGVIKVARDSITEGQPPVKGKPPR